MQSIYTDIYKVYRHTTSRENRTYMYRVARENMNLNGKDNISVYLYYYVQVRENICMNDVAYKFLLCLVLAHIQSIHI